ncbi:MAG TPA: NADH-quinone oxidoreductase subunit NuoN [Magnetospirillaceae bacterium]|nr:NADH-quinone oxidoreductase subunit NuoN [Magnetospirillaceae bacterium]
MELPNLIPALPELLIVASAILLLMIGVFKKENAAGGVTALGIIALALTALLVVSGPSDRVETFGGMFVVDSFAVFSKLLVLLASAVTLAMSRHWLKAEGLDHAEYPVLVLFATLGMMLMISANNFMSLYLGLELQSLALYVLAASQRDSGRATEAGLKYFVLGSLASGMLLYGASLVYGFSGTTGFDALAKALAVEAPVGVTVGMVFILAGLAFKISAAPFHMWAPDVYEGAPTPVTAFFAVAPKIAAFALLLRVLTGPFGSMVEQWQQVIVFVSIASMVIGGFGAIVQNNIKRLMAYSSIGHVGFALVGLAAGGADGVRSVLIYLAIYLAMNAGAFAVILSMRQKGRSLEGIDDLAGLSKTHPMMAVSLAILMWSMAGIPPFAGFWSKWMVFSVAIDKGLIALSVIGVLTSVVSAFYYLRIIKVMYFDEPADGIDRSIGAPVGLVMGVATLAVLLFNLVPAGLFSSASTAAASLFGG